MKTVNMVSHNKIKNHKKVIRLQYDTVNELKDKVITQSPTTNRLGKTGLRRSFYPQSIGI